MVLEVINVFMVCDDCLMAIANNDYTGIESDREAAWVRKCVKALGPHIVVGDAANTEEFSPRRCDCCQGLPGRRHQVCELGPVAVEGGAA